MEEGSPLPNHKKKKGDNDDRISALPDDVLVSTLQFVDLRTAVRTGALARRWRHLPRLLSSLVIDVNTVAPPHHPQDHTTVDSIMKRYTDSTRWLLAGEERSIKSLCLAFYLIDPYLHTIGDALLKTVSSTTPPSRLEFTIRTELPAPMVDSCQRVALGRRFMSFLAASPVVFSWVTSLALQNLRFTASDFMCLLHACSRLQLLSLTHCGTYAADSILSIDAPDSSSLLALEIHACFYHTVELVRVPKLERLLCDFDTMGVKFPLRFGCVPCLHDINLSITHLSYYYQNTRQLSPAFSNLREIFLGQLGIFGMAWTIFVLEAAPLLKKLKLSMEPWLSSFATTVGPRKTNVSGEAPNFEHCNLSLLEMSGYGLRNNMQVLQFIRLIRNRAVCLKRIHFREQCRYTTCKGARCSCQLNEPQRNLLNMVLTLGFSSPIEITIEKMSSDGISL